MQTWTSFRVGPWFNMTCVLMKRDTKGIWVGFPVGSVVKNLPTNSGAVGDVGSIPGWGRSPGEGNKNPLHYFCLENPMDRGAWWATAFGVAKRRTWLNDMHAYRVYVHRGEIMGGYLDLPTSSLQNCEKWIYVLRQPVCGILLWKP